jgi:diaminopropionate ammonia-lyase
MHMRACRARIEAIEKEGAEVKIVQGNYDDALSQMAQDVKNNGWVVVADTAWPGYETVPHHIMAGYTVLIATTDPFGRPPLARKQWTA